MTRQLTGAVPLPSSRLVSTVSMTVPSSSGCNGPAALIGSVRSGVRSRRSPVAGAGASCAVGRDWSWAAAGRAAPALAPPVARTNCLRDLVKRGCRVVARRLTGGRGQRRDRRPGALASGRRLRTTLLANRLSYSRRLRSAAIGSSGAGPAGSSKRGAAGTAGCGGLAFQRLSRFHRPKAFLVVPQPIRVRSDRSRLRLRRSSAGGSG